MKRTYKAPIAKLVDFTYDTQVNASSGNVEYCWGVIWKGSLQQAYCTNPGEWWGDPSYTNPPSVKPFSV